MKTNLITTIAIGILLNTNTFAQGGYSGGVKPSTISQTPSFADYFQATSVDKLSKTKSFVVSQFNLNIAEEEYIDLRSGGVKGNIDNAMLNLQFKLINLDKTAIQSATNELYNYLIEKLKSEGFTVKEYEKVKTHKSFQKLTINESFNGSYVSGIEAGSRPGFNDIASAKFVGFSANSMPSITIAGMKGAKLVTIGSDLEADVLNFGASVHFIEWQGKTMNTGKVEAEYKAQVFFGTSNMTIFPYKKIGFVTMIDQKPYGYTFGKEFVTEIKEGANQAVINNAKYKTYEVTIDNAKFKAVLLELGKSYIDNMVNGLNQK